MISTNGGLDIFGVDLSKKTAIVVADGKGGYIHPKNLLRIRSDGEPAGADFYASLGFSSFKVVGKILYVIHQTLPLVEELPYNVGGYVYPTGVTVGLVEGNLDAFWDRLDESRLLDYVENPDRKTLSAEDGYFQFNDIHDLPAVTLVVGIPVAQVGIVGAQALKFSAWATPEGTADDSVRSIILTLDDNNPEGGEARHADVEISGTVPDGVSQVYLSYGRVRTVQQLAEESKAIATPEADGTYMLKANYLGEGKYSVSIISDTWAGFTAEITKIEWQICLSGDTLITMADGTTRRMDALAVGDLVRAGDGSAVRVTRTARGHFNDHHTLYTFADGTVINEVHAHRFFNADQGFYQLLSRWHIGDHALRQDGEHVALVSVKRVDEPEEMFGLWTESHDYFAGGLLSGETAANQHLIANATADMAADMAASLDEAAALELLGLGGLLP